ncbi:hypothetical protein L1987_14492 [Smallanthus sonchifolius]|uniref:Uncharacterized protein n=1 Tax=Smallanthus sonchifolius TaxID=185202 RepID=A0ACB9J563_9ASTR|nr:hypothetical protein L1987_14492 [Smallanthus sonchifolius]
MTHFSIFYYRRLVVSIGPYPCSASDFIAAPLLSSVEDLHPKIESSTSFKFSYQHLHISRLANLLLKHV